MVPRPVQIGSGCRGDLKEPNLMVRVTHIHCLITGGAGFIGSHPAEARRLGVSVGQVERLHVARGQERPYGAGSGGTQGQRS